MNRKVFLEICGGGRDENIRFAGLRGVLLDLGFVERVRGSHHIFAKPGVAEILNLQPKGASAKPYQVKQVRKVIQKYTLASEEE